MGKAKTSKPTFADWLTDRVLRGIIGALSLLPYRQRIAGLGWVLRRIIGPLTGYLKRAEDNLALVYPDMPAETRRQTAQESCDNFGRSFMEFQSAGDFRARIATTQPTGPGVAALKDAVANGKPVIFATAHFGNPEAPRHVLTQMGYTVGSLYRPMQNPYFNDLYVGALKSLGAPVFEQGHKGTMAFVRHLLRGGMGALYFDVSAPGAVLPFMGHPARTALSLGEIALRIDAVVIPYFGIRQSDGVSFQIELETPIEHTTPEGMLLALNDRLEAQIKRNKEQWFWVHRRWKTGKK